MGDIYDDKAQAQDAAFAEQVAASLRGPERAHPSFEKRLMEKVRIEGRLLYKGAATSPNNSWWRTEWIIRVSPRGGVAIAAGIVAVVALSSLALGKRISTLTQQPAITAQAAPARDTVQVVRFVFVDSGASNVALVGDFNEWTRGATQLKRSGAPGVWTVSVPLTPGRHEYAFIINGSRWVADPLAVRSSDDFGTESSVIRIGKTGKTET
jgi:hypothetical protein